MHNRLTKGNIHSIILDDTILLVERNKPNELLKWYHSI